MSGVPAELPEGRRGQLLALGLLIVSVGVVWAALVAPLLDWYGARSERLAEQRAVLAHMTRLAATLPALKQTTRASEQPAAALLGGESDAIAGAALQGMVQDMASAAGATLASAEALPGEQLGSFRRIALRVTLNADWPVLVAMLQAVESSQIRLLVDDLQVHATARAQAGPSGASPLQASFVVLGFRPGRGDSGAPNGGARTDLRAEVSARGQ